MYFWERRNEIRDRDEKSAGCGILVKKERECGIRTPPSRPCISSPNLLQLKLEEKLLGVLFLLMCKIQSDVNVSDEYLRILHLLDLLK